MYFQEVDEYKESRTGTLNQVFQDPGQYHNIEATLSSKQYGFKVGLKVFKSKGLAAIFSEIEDNLHGRGVIEPAPASEVTGEDASYFDMNSRCFLPSAHPRALIFPHRLCLRNIKYGWDVFRILPVTSFSGAGSMTPLP